MEYIYETERLNYEDFASGRVLYNARGTTSFPVRAASEIIQRCFQLLQAKGKAAPYSLYDPCCGGAYLLTVIGLLHGSRIQRILGSDIQSDLVSIAEKNLSLLNESGLNQRKVQLDELFKLYHKPSHREALESVERLAGLIAQSAVQEAGCFQTDITRPGEWPAACRDIHIVITDFPYGELVRWEGESPDPVASFFENIYQVLDPEFSVAAVIADKGQKLKHERFRKLQSLKLGKRQAVIFEPIRPS